MSRLGLFTAVVLASLVAACSPRNAGNMRDVGAVLSTPSTEESSTPEVKASLIQMPQEDTVHIARRTAAEESPYARSKLVACRDEAWCNPSVGMLLSVKATDKPDQFQTYRCTASLIGDDTIVTNSHCLTPLYTEPKAAAGDCSAIEVHFPAGKNHPYAVAHCTEIIYDSGVSQDEKKDRGPDVALLRIREKGIRPHLAVSTDGFANNEEFSIYRVTPKAHPQGLPTGLLETQKCKAVQNSLILPAYTETHTVVVALRECPFVQGNSGSPVIDANGRVRGVGQAILTYPDVPAQFPNSIMAPLTDFIQATNLGCLGEVLEKVVGEMLITSGATCRGWDAKPAIGSQLALQEAAVRTWRETSFPIYRIEANGWLNLPENRHWIETFQWSITNISHWDAAYIVPIPTCIMPGTDVSTLPASITPPVRALNLNFASDLTYVPHENASRKLHIDLKLEKQGDDFLLAYSYRSANRTETVKLPLKTCAAHTVPVASN